MKVAKVPEFVEVGSALGDKEGGGRYVRPPLKKRGGGGERERKRKIREREEQARIKKIFKGGGG